MSDEDPRSQTHPDYPTLAYDAWQWAMDGMLEGRPRNIAGEVAWSNDDNELSELLEKAIFDVLCTRYGHQVEDDQCGIPGHRFCLWCHKSMPNLPIGRLAP